MGMQTIINKVGACTTVTKELFNSIPWCYRLCPAGPGWHSDCSWGKKTMQYSSSSYAKMKVINLNLCERWNSLVKRAVSSISLSKAMQSLRWYREGRGSGGVQKNLYGEKGNDKISPPILQEAKNKTEHILNPKAIVFFERYVVYSRW